MRDPVEDFALEDRIQAPFEHPDLAGFVDDRVTPIEVANQLLERSLAAGDLGRDIGCGDGLIEFGGLAAHLPAGSGFAPHPGDFGAKVTAPDCIEPTPPGYARMTRSIVASSRSSSISLSMTEKSARERSAALASFSRSITHLGRRPRIPPSSSASWA